MRQTKKNGTFRICLWKIFVSEMRLNRIFTSVCVAVMLALPTGASAFDWKPQSNEELKGDMISFARQFADSSKGTRASGIVRKLLKKQSRSKDPYSWIADTHWAVRELKKSFGPELVLPGTNEKKAYVRRAMLQLLDFPLHVDERGEGAPEAMVDAYETAKQIYLASAREDALSFFDSPAPQPGTLEMVKIYNMGFGLRTSEHTVLIDVRWDGTAGEADFLAEKADIFLLTHPHVDHYSRNILEAFARKGKTVILPCDLLPDFIGTNKHIINEASDAVDFGGIKLNIFPGNQGERVPNNVYIIETDGWRIIHQGDNADLVQQGRISEYPACDIVIGSTWNGIRNLIDAAMAADGGCMPVLIPAHENEITQHGVDHRESYHEMFNRRDRLGDPDFKYPPYLLMDIGECVTFSRQESEQPIPESQYLYDGYTSTPRSQCTYAISKLVPEANEVSTYLDIYDYLRGRVPGVIVKPDKSILIRGINSINSSTEPLILVNGIEIRDLSTLNPQDVKSIDVLKDASASIYGVRGANGVIIIQLK